MNKSKTFKIGDLMIEIKWLKEVDFFFDKSKNKCYSYIHIGPMESWDAINAFLVVVGHLSISWAFLP